MTFVLVLGNQYTACHAVPGITVHIYRPRRDNILLRNSCCCSILKQNAFSAPMIGMTFEANL
jgi:hypothetical protein